MFKKLKKHLGEEDVSPAEKKAMVCMRDLLRWTKTALKEEEKDDENKMNKLEWRNRKKRRSKEEDRSDRLREELHVMKMFHLTPPPPPKKLFIDTSNCFRDKLLYPFLDGCVDDF